MTTSNEIDFDSPFVKKEQCCKICGETEGPMESIFCKADDTAMLNKIYKCTRVEVTPVCGLISPVCEHCHRRIDAFDENAPPKVIEYVIKTDLDPEPLDYDPLNVGDMSDPMGDDVKSEDDSEEPACIYVTKIVKRRGRRKASDEPVRGRAARRPGRPKLKVEPKKPRKSLSSSREERISLDEGSSCENEADHLDERPSSEKERAYSHDEDNSKFTDLASDLDDDEALDHEEEEEDESALDEEVDEHTNSEEEPRKRGRPKRTARGATTKSPKQCEVCGKQVKYMAEHMRQHLIESQHPCPHCDRTFVQANNLRYHIRKHLGEKPYACKQCKKRFYCEAHLKSHMRVHGPQGLFQCTVCSKSFNQECNLKKHLRVHTGEKPYVCDKCGKRFNSTSNLRNHARLHSEERPLTCDHCAKSFVDVHHLQRHIRVHTGERPYICHVCFQAFYCQTGLMEHLKTHIEKKNIKLD
ncbi:zinc finger protein 37-like [Anopheles merus]|uniref:zinc finger protein 37-like n=1 Tax=Anopheles merus TaxID=30066 RepID=UPI001BE4806D|nr:zinc finger protein 37-like [Anopheles merus]